MTAVMTLNSLAIRAITISSQHISEELPSPTFEFCLTDKNGIVMMLNHASRIKLQAILSRFCLVKLTFWANVSTCLQTLAPPDAEAGQLHVLSPTRSVQNHGVIETHYYCETKSKIWDLDCWWSCKKLDSSLVLALVLVMPATLLVSHSDLSVILEWASHLLTSCLTKKESSETIASTEVLLEGVKLPF